MQHPERIDHACEIENPQEPARYPPNQVLIDKDPNDARWHKNQQCRDPNKTEAIILKTSKEPCPEEEQPPQLQINGQTIRYVKSTNVLGSPA